jgi:hypothetical protein
MVRPRSSHVGKSGLGKDEQQDGQVLIDEVAPSRCHLILGLFGRSRRACCAPRRISDHARSGFVLQSEYYARQLRTADRSASDAEDVE